MAVFLVLGFGVSGSVRFPGVSLFVFFFWFSGIWRFFVACALASCVSSLRIGQEHCRTSRLQWIPPPSGRVSRVARLLLGVVPGTRWCTAGGVRGVHCDPFHDHHYRNCFSR